VPYPRVTWSPGPAGPWPTIFYLGGTPLQRRLYHQTKDLAAGWSAPQEAPGDGVSSDTPVAGPFDVVTPWNLSRDILGLGELPACPCRAILHQHMDGVSGNWAPAQDVTATHDEYDAARSPRLAFDLQGNTHAFWAQLATGADLAPKRHTLEYRRRTAAGTWEDRSAPLAGQNGPRLGDAVGLDVTPAGQPLLAWSRRDTVEGVPQPEQVWIARTDWVSAVPDEETPRARPEISAWPNPFNPRVTLSLEVAVAGPVRLDIFDVRGQRLRTLIDEVLPADRHEVLWDGTDTAGRSLPSGVYFARAVTVVGSATYKLVLAR